VPAGAAIADPTIPQPVSGSCAATCERLAKCDLATPSCAFDCEQGRLDLTCLNAATTCSDRARCSWGQLCGRPLKTGTGSCADAVGCWGTHGAKSIEEQCSLCYDRMSATTALEFGRYYLCWKSAMQQAAADPKFDVAKAMAERCQPLMDGCFGVKRAPCHPHGVVGGWSLRCRGREPWSSAYWCHRAGVSICSTSRAPPRNGMPSGA
jgi:hypothetical protein